MGKFHMLDDPAQATPTESGLHYSGFSYKQGTTTWSNLVKIKNDPGIVALLMEPAVYAPCGVGRF
jgi:hypothetical protein